MTQNSQMESRTHISTPVKTVTVATISKLRVIKVKWSHKENSEDQHNERTGAISVHFNEKENYSVLDVIKKFKSEIIRKSVYTDKDFEDCFEDLALPSQKKKNENKEDNKQPAIVIDEFRNKKNQICSIWEFAKIHKNGRYIMLYLLTERICSPKKTKNSEFLNTGRSDFLNLELLKTFPKLWNF